VLGRSAKPPSSRFSNERFYAPGSSGPRPHAGKTACSRAPTTLRAKARSRCTSDLIGGRAPRGLQPEDPDHRLGRHRLLPDGRAPKSLPRGSSWTFDEGWPPRRGCGLAGPPPTQKPWSFGSLHARWRIGRSTARRPGPVDAARSSPNHHTGQLTQTIVGCCRDAGAREP
jgi:hypothetical protein